MSTDRRSSEHSQDTLVDDSAAAAETKNAPKQEDEATHDEEVELQRQRRLRSSEVDKTGPLRQHKTSRYALEKPHEVQGDDEDKANEVKWGENDPEDPHQWSKRYRLWLTFVCSFVTMNVTFASSAPSSAVMALSEEFGFSMEIASLITATFLFGYVVGPFFWAPGSELFGRKPIFVATLLCSSLFTLADAVAPNRTTLFICRFLAGFFSAAPLTNCGGLIADVWGPVGRGFAMTVFTACVFIGCAFFIASRLVKTPMLDRPAIGPTIGGFIVLNKSWRVIFWVMFAWSMFCTILMAVAVPETFSPILLKKRAQKLRKEDPEKNGGKWSPAERLDKSPSGLLHLTIIKPFEILFQEPILIVITIYLSIVYAILYGTFSAFPLIWEDLRGFNTGESGLIFLGIMIGAILGSALNFFFSSKYRTLTDEFHGQVPPEYRLLGSIAAGPALIVSLFWLGWTGAYESVPWWVPALATIPLGASFCLLFISFLSYIVDTYLMHAASALAANTIIRSALASVFPLFTTQLFKNLGIQWASTLLGCIAIILAPSPILFYKYGDRIRQRSHFAPNLDLKMRAQKEQEKGEA